MAKITFKGSPVATVGELPAPGAKAPAFRLVATDLSEVTNADVAGKRVVLNIFPSVDTAVCAMSVRQFNQRAAGLPGTVVLCVSKDLPFAHKRFCGAEGIENVRSVSSFRGPDFGRDYGVTMTDGPLAGLFARAVVVLDGQGKVVHRQLVPEIAQEPDYDAALAAGR
ncbi:MAG: thiol peroxidase [Planctomycetes bacterium]|nr:thiol peroxidase [Planctomycetota bacterium]